MKLYDTASRDKKQNNSPWAGAPNRLAPGEF